MVLTWLGMHVHMVGLAAMVLRPSVVHRTHRAVACAHPYSSVAPTPAAAVRPPLPDGVVVVHKPSGWTSFDVVGKIRGTLEKHFRELGHTFKRRSRLKVGHGGTLDPLATGLLVVGVGGGCRQLQGYLEGAKAYAARAQLGQETDTQDCGGTSTATAPFDHVARDDLERAAAGLTGRIMQRPPIYSAIRKDGKRLHELARAGQISAEEVEPRPTTVYSLSVGEYDAASGSFELEVRCSGGTYVRSLIEEMGRAVGSAAHMTALERTQHGPFCAAGGAVEARLRASEAERAVGVVPVQSHDFGDAGVLLGRLDEHMAALADADASQ